MGVDIEELKRGLFLLNSELEAAVDIPFADVPKNHWAKVAVADLKSVGAIKGYPPK
jgi:hypothetical protein